MTLAERVDTLCANLISDAESLSGEALIERIDGRLGSFRDDADTLQTTADEAREDLRTLLRLCGLSEHEWAMMRVSAQVKSPIEFMVDRLKAHRSLVG